MDHIGIISGLPMDKASLMINLGFIQPIPSEGLLAVVFLFWQLSYPPRPLGRRLKARGKCLLKWALCMHRLVRM